MIIDAHTHALHGPTLDKIASAGGDFSRKLVDREIEYARRLEIPTYLDVTLRVETLENNGIDFQVCTPGAQRMDPQLFPGDITYRIKMVKAFNEDMVRLMEDSKGKLLSIGMVPLENFNEECIKEMERVAALGLKGFNVPSNVNGKPLDAPEFDAFWSKVVAMDLPVYIHPRDPLGHHDRPYEKDFDLSHNFGWPYDTVLSLAHLVLSGFMERYPLVNIVSHHLGGGMIPFFFGRSLETYELPKQNRLIGKTLPKTLYDYFSKFYYDTAVGGSAAAIRCCYDVFGKADRIVFATDAPFGPKHGEGRLESYPEIICLLGLPATENEKILSGNARKLLHV